MIEKNDVNIERLHQFRKTKGYREVRYEKAEKMRYYSETKRSWYFEVEGEFLFIKRQTHLNVFPGYTSFPGGKVDKSRRNY